MTDCLFCKIVRGEIPAAMVYETDAVLAFKDIHPKAPTHVLVVPKKHIATVDDVEPGDAALLGQLFLAAREIARQAGVVESGYRLAVNCGAGAGQTVFHVHLHVLGGRGMQWPSH
jgi:histidine triad (HIT) family protein